MTSNGSKKGKVVMFFLPTSSDAPIYHRSYGTIAMMAFCVIATLGAAFGFFANPAAYILTYDGIHPIQWVTSIFLHAGFLHLIGNLIFLWVFGQIIEGKMGWNPFVLLFFAIGITQNIAEQIIYQGTTAVSGSLGASSVIFGLMAIAWLWAPKNRVHFKAFFFILPVFSFTVTIQTVALFYIGWALVGAWLEGFAVTTNLLHFSGAIVGLLIGYLLLRSESVDCEGWDLISLWTKGRPTFRTTQTDAHLRAPQNVEDWKERREHRQRRRKAEKWEAIDRLMEFLRDGRSREACQLHAGLVRRFGKELELPRRVHKALIKATLKEKRYEQAVPALEAFIQRYPTKAAKQRLWLAQLLVRRDNRPARALKILSGLDDRLLKEKQRDLKRRLLSEARTLRHQGVLELADEV